MDVVERWSERIAQRFAPEEIDFAAEVGKAYATGGQARKDLLPRHNVQPGAFGAGAFATELPWVLQALDQASKALIAVLRSQYLGNALAAGSLLVALPCLPTLGEAPAPLLISGPRAGMETSLR